MKGEEEAYALYPARRKMMNALAISAVSLVLAVLLTAKTVAENAGGLKPRVAVVAILSTTLYFLVTLSLRLRAPRPIVEADAAGVLIPGVVRIGWGDLDRIEAVKVPFRHLVFHLREGSSLNRRYERFLPPYSEGREPIVVLTLAAEPTVDIVAAIEAMRPAAHLLDRQ